MLSSKPFTFHPFTDEQFEKITVINSDLTQIGLGLSSNDRATLLNSVNLVIHIAASVKFDVPFK